MKKNVMLVLGILLVTIMLGLSGSVLFGLFNNDQEKGIVFTDTAKTRSISASLSNIVPTQTVSQTYTVKNETTVTMGVRLEIWTYIGQDDGMGQYLDLKISSGDEVLYEGLLLSSPNSPICIDMPDRTKKITVSYHMPKEVTSEQAEGKSVKVSLRFILTNE